uniref:Uncharacterized protein n=1 Tax=Heterorhabditis bacteriophora TaxID=37862 RepID=A0A1I7WWW1_HETBA
MFIGICCFKEDYINYSISFVCLFVHF